MYCSTVDRMKVGEELTLSLASSSAGHENVCQISGQFFVNCCPSFLTKSVQFFTIFTK